MRGRAKRKKRDRRQGFSVYKRTRAVSPCPSTGSEKEDNLADLANEVRGVEQADARGPDIGETDIAAALARIEPDDGISDGNLMEIVHKVHRNNPMPGTSRACLPKSPVHQLQESDGGNFIVLLH